MDGRQRRAPEASGGPRGGPADVEELQREIHRRMGGPARLRLALEMSVAARTMGLERLRLQRPQYSEAGLKRAPLREAFPPDRIPPPLR